jgi:hypothetical protein
MSICKSRRRIPAAGQELVSGKEGLLITPRVRRVRSSQREETRNSLCRTSASRNTLTKADAIWR